MEARLKAPAVIVILESIEAASADMWRVRGSKEMPEADSDMVDGSRASREGILDNLRVLVLPDVVNWM